MTIDMEHFCNGNVVVMQHKHAFKPELITKANTLIGETIHFYIAEDTDLPKQIIKLSFNAKLDNNKSLGMMQKTDKKCLCRKELFMAAWF